MRPYIPFVLVKSHKSVGIAILLAFLFGPIGLFYASVTGGLIMTFTPVVLVLVMIIGIIRDSSDLFGWSFVLMLGFALTYWLICMIWSVVGVSDYNRGIDTDLKRQEELWSKLNSRVAMPELQRSKREGSIPLQDWLASNPGKSVNDYFTKFKN
jgi:hypothetical protein